MAKAKKFDNMDEPLPRPDPVHDRPSHPPDPDKVAAGDIMCIQTYVMVKEVVDGGESLVVEDLFKPGEFSIDGRDMIADMKSASYYDKGDIRRVSKTQMVDIMTSVGGDPFSVSYAKKDGQERLLVGKFLRHERHYGRSLVVDLQLLKEWNDAKAEALAAGKTEEQAIKIAEAKTDGYLRLVDHRTMDYLITDGVRYELS
jgi:hypothetical protein